MNQYRYYLSYQCAEPQAKILPMSTGTNMSIGYSFVCTNKPLDTQEAISKTIDAIAKGAGYMPGTVLVITCLIPLVGECTVAGHNHSD